MVCVFCGMLNNFPELCSTIKAIKIEDCIIYQARLGTQSSNIKVNRIIANLVGWALNNVSVLKWIYHRDHTNLSRTQPFWSQNLGMRPWAHKFCANLNTKQRARDKLPILNHKSVKNGWVKYLPPVFSLGKVSIFAFPYLLRQKTAFNCNQEY